MRKFFNINPAAGAAGHSVKILAVVLTARIAKIIVSYCPDAPKIYTTPCLHAPGCLELRVCALKHSASTG